MIPRLFFFFVAACLHSVACAGSPNILFLLSDDHSYPFLSTYGDPNVSTPVLDQLASDGMKFHRFFTAAPQCVPSRAALLTGRSPVAARMTRFSSPLPADEITFAEMLRDQAGYYTGICGRGYHLDGSAWKQPDVQSLIAKHSMKTFKSRVDYLATGSDYQVAEQVTTFLDAKPKDKPFFLWAGFSDPHHVWDAKANFRPDPAKLKLPPHLPDLPGVREELANYCAEVNRLDGTIGKILEILQSRDLFDNTFIVFCGDNGAAFPHGKGSLYDIGSNVPMVVRWPGHIQANQESRQLLSGEDLAPTFLAVAGLAPGPKMSGKSFLPLLEGKPYEPREYVFVERGPHGDVPVSQGMQSGGYDLGRAVRSERYKFIYNCTPWIPYAPVDSARGPMWQQMMASNKSSKLDRVFANSYFTHPRPVYEFYDLANDPGELNNLSGTAEVIDIEKKHRLAMAEKMLLEFDYLPIPDLFEKRGE
jgi:N-sulfoglucosamine sulfohydrolase